MQSLGTQTRILNLDFNITCKTASMYSTSDQWTPAPQEDLRSLSMPSYTDFPLASSRQSDNPFILQSNYGQPGSNNHDFRLKPALEPVFSSFRTQPSNNAPLGASTTVMYSSPAVCTASNASYDPATISPMDTHFDVDHVSPRSDTKSSFDSHMRNIAPSDFATFTPDTESPSSKRRCDSLQSSFESYSPTMPQAQVGRRRGSEYAVPGSARAIYLEKNRKAASKCRSKQKRQQEELVETARDVERRNKILKAEVELLKSGMRDLMELVGQHADCPDARLKLYVQREANRLATGCQRNSLPSPLSRTSFCGPSSTDKASSLKND